MTLGKRGKRGVATRSVAIAALLSMLLGSFRVSYAGDVGKAPTSSSGTAGTMLTGKLESDTPWSLPRRVRPARIVPLDGAADESGLGRLFDERSDIGLTTSGRPARFRVELPEASFIEAVGFFGAADGSLTVAAEGGPLVAETKLAGGRPGWNRIPVSASPKVRAVVVEWRPAKADASLRELEIWGRVPNSGSNGLPLTDLLHTGAPNGALELKSASGEQTVALSAAPGPGTGGLFEVDLPRDPAAFERAFLVYELRGLPHFTAAPRSLNGLRRLGGFGAVFGAKGGRQVEEIAPGWLRRGKNRVQFFPPDGSNPASYRVSDVRVIGIPLPDSRPAGAAEGDWEALLDGRETTGWRARAGKPTQPRSWAFDGTSQPFALELRMPRRARGTLTVTSTGPGSRGEIAVKLDELTAGWHRVPLDRLPAANRLTLSLSGAGEEEAAISELAVTASPWPADRAPRMSVTYPLSGECVNGKVHVRGFVVPADANAVTVNGTPRSGALSPDGAFALDASAKEIGGADNKPFAVAIEAIYPGGGRIRRDVKIAGCADRPPAIVDDTGKRREPKEDLGAPYGTLVKAGEEAVLSFAGAKLEIPAGAVEKDVRVTIRPLQRADVAPLDSGMTNITPKAQAFRFGPHGMIFKKPVRLTLPYDRALIPAGHTQADVRTFYYDEGLKRWEQVGLIDQQDGRMVAVTEHFTDFINASLAMPEHPGTTSFNPTTLKDIKMADPHTGIPLIAPPGASSSGAAGLRFPIELPPGRRGLQPTVELRYSSEAGNGWVGQGWDLATPSIQIDTRFGVPKYDGTDTYLLDGEMLTPLAQPPTGAPAGQYFGRRVEGRFDWIRRDATGTGGRDFSWVVTDKNGVRYTYGSAAGSVLAPLINSAPDRTRIFRWYLERVEDPHGNQIRYFYVRDSGTNGEPFVQIYPERIEYTAHSSGNPTPAYSVTFDLNPVSTPRPDPINSARSGFQVVTRRRLAAINVKFIHAGANQTIRRYELTYKTGDLSGHFNKSLLQNIGMKGLGGTGSPLYQYGFQYAQVPRDASNRPAIFGAPQEWALAKNLDQSNHAPDTLTTTNQSATSKAGGGGVGTSFAYLGGQVSNISGADNTRWTLSDLNGDGLPDPFDASGFASRQSLVRNPGSVSGSMTGVPYPGTVAPHSHVDREIMNAALGIFGSASLNCQIDLWNRTKEVTTLIDMNGDGFPDRASLGGGSTLNALMNTGTGFTSQRTWTNFMPSGAGEDCEFLDVIFEDLPNLVSDFADCVPGVDTITGWVNGAVGSVVSVLGSVTKGFAGGDGVEAAIYQNNNPTPIWRHAIAPGEVTPCVPGPNNTCNTGPLTVSVGPTDRLYFRVSGLADRVADHVVWKPEIRHNVSSGLLGLREPFGAFIYRHIESDDFRLVGTFNMPWVSISQGQVNIEGTFVKQTTPDEVRLRVTQWSPQGNPTILRDLYYGPEQAVTEFISITEVAVQRGSRLTFEVLSDVAIDPRRAAFRPFVTYTDICRPNPDTGGPTCGGVTISFDSRENRIYSMNNDPDPQNPIPQTVFEQTPWPVYPMFRWRSATPAHTQTHVRPSAGQAVIAGTVTKGVTPAPVIVLVQGVNHLYFKQVLAANATGSFPVHLTTPSLAAGDQLFFSIHSDLNPGSGVAWTPTVNGAAAPVNVRFRPPELSRDPDRPGMSDKMAGGYHGWRYGMWNGRRPFIESKITTDPPNDSYGIVLPFRTSPDKFFGLQTEDGTLALFEGIPVLGDIEEGLEDFGGEVAGYASDIYGAGKDLVTGLGNVPGIFLRGVMSLPGLWADINRYFFCNVLGIGGGVEGGIALRYSEGDNTSFSASVPGFGGGFNKGGTRGHMDLIDVNGDLLPDIVSSYGIKFNRGSTFDQNFGPKLPYRTIRSAQHRNLSANVGLAGNLYNKTDASGKSTGFISAGVGFGGAYGMSATSHDLVDINGDGLPDHVKQQGGNLLVRLNYGNGFAANDIVWSGAPWGVGSPSRRNELLQVFGADLDPNTVRMQDTEAIDVGLSLGGGVPAFSASANSSRNTSVARTLVDLVDINGDGLPDQLLRAPGSPDMLVKLNRGDRFDSVTTVGLAPWPVDTSPSSFLGAVDALGFTRELISTQGLSGSGTFLAGNVPVTLSGGLSESNGTSWQTMGFEDIDGDGKADQVIKLEGSPIVHARRNQVGPTNLLTRVDSPVGGSIQINYDRQGNFVDHSQSPQVDMPRNQWTMSSVTVDDGRGNRYRDTFDYRWHTRNVGSGFYDRAEREEYGYGRVLMTRQTFDPLTQVFDINDSRVESFFHNRDFYRKGLVQAQFEEDEQGRPLRAVLFTYDDPGAATFPLLARTGRFFPKETQRVTAFYENVAVTVPAALASSTGSAPKYRLEKRVFDADGDLTSFEDWGDEGSTADDVLYSLTNYLKESGTHITRPRQIDAAPRTAPTVSLRRRTATYFAGRGTIDTLTNIVSGGKVPATGVVYNQAASISRFTYDAFGNVKTAADPSGYTLTYGYDTLIQTYPTSAIDSFLLTSTSTPNYFFGVDGTVTDTNGQLQTFTFDNFGRLSTLTAPADQGSTPTISMTYSQQPGVSVFPAWASTKHKDFQFANDPIETVTFKDGLGRVVQTKKDIDEDVDGVNVRTGMSASGQVFYDSRGNVTSVAQPEFSSTAPGNFDQFTILNPTLSLYDKLGRVTQLILPDDATTTTRYRVIGPQDADNLGDGRTWLATEVTDANGNRRLAYSDTRGNQVAVREFNVIGAGTTLVPLTTRYTYNPIDELLTVTDAKAKVTSSDYDTVGQIVRLISPDAGQIEYRYDLAGNLRAKETPVLRGLGQLTRYEYDFNRLRRIDYPTSTDVTYTYGAPNEGGNTAGNLAGRVKQMTSDGGSELRFYDSLGNIRETRTTLPNMAATTPASITFTMKYAYDWLGRMRTMTFPNWMNNNSTFVSGEGELITYFYNHGGNLDRITGFHQTPNPQQTSHPRNFEYLRHIGYDAFGQRSVLTAGNGIKTRFNYDFLTRRLITVDAEARGQQEVQQNRPATPFLRLRYTYDDVGNVTRMVNSVSVQPWRNGPVFVGPMDASYTYDNLYQLKSMTAKYRPNVAYGYQHTTTFRYDEIGNFTRKAQSHDRLVWDNQTVNTSDQIPEVTQLAGSRFDHNIIGTSYTLDYQYTGPRPHATNAITETPPNQTARTRNYSYDTNGNNTGNTVPGETRVQIWDEDSRLKQVNRNGGTLARFRYNDQGERTKKQTSAGDSWYANQFFVLLPGNRPTKHIFAGETRVATKTDAIFMQTPLLNFYHPDHLGTTSYTTTLNQDLVQHERYFTFGELWRPNGPQEEIDLGPSGAERREWLFTSKEWDVDTSLYYFGARYLDPRTGVWQSTDPILASYIQRGPAGASPKNLGLYTYGWNNPIVMRDPDGRETFAGASQQDLRRFQTESKAAQGVNPGAIMAGAARGFGGSGPSAEFAAKNAWVLGATTPSEFETLATHVAYAQGGMNGARAALGEYQTLGIMIASNIIAELPLMLLSGGAAAGPEAAAAGTGRLVLFHGTTPSAAARIAAGGFRAAGTDAVFFGEELATARFFGHMAALQRGTSGAYTVLRFEVPSGMAGLFERGAIGAFRGVRFADIAGSSGMEAMLMGRNIGAFNAALRSGAIGVQRLRFGLGM
jgi:RHS repeat-associated protein